MKRVLIVSLLVCAIVVPPVAAGSHPLVPAAFSLEERRRQLEQVLARLTQGRLRLHEVQQQEHRVLGELEGIDRSREAAERRLEVVTTDLRRTQTRAQAAATRLVTTRRALSVQQARLHHRLRDIYKYGQVGYLEVLLGAGDFGEFVTRWHFVSAVVEADSRLISAYSESVTRYQQLHHDLVAAQSNLRTLAGEAEAQHREIVAAELVKQMALRRLQAERSAYERMVRELEQNSKDLEILIQRAQSGAPRNQFGLVPGRGRFLWPARGIFTSGFGMRRLFGISRMHTGQDIAAPWGSPVTAAADGTVLYTGWFGGYGQIVVLDHGNNVSTLYAHLSSILVPTGAAVNRGQVIGHVGSTGYSTGPHVHFEIRINGRPVDPAKLAGP